MNKFIAITIGDINGIGIEILIDLWKKRKIKNFVLFCNFDIFQEYLIKKNIKININCINTDKKKLNIRYNFFNLFTYRAINNEINTYYSLTNAYKFSKKINAKGIITLPLRKDLIRKKIDNNFIGHTEFFQRKDKKLYSNMILFHKKIIISTLTTHLPINLVSKKLSNKKFLYNQIINLHKSLKKDFNIKDPKIILSGFNPHAGENGEIGIEEKKNIGPLVKKIKNKKISIDGPFSADSMINKKNLEFYDCFLFCFHDQALIPFKYISKFEGVNYTSNLSIIRVSPDHGTAYELVGTKNYSSKSLFNCFELIDKIFKNRKINDQS